MIMARAFYMVKPAIPRRVQISLRKTLVHQRRQAHADTWPIDHKAAKPPKNWRGWPEGKQFAVVLTHDVELQHGHDRCRDLLHLEQDLGFCSSFNFVPERYRVSPELRRYITAQGFEVGVHGLKHDGKLYQSWQVFKERAARINQYIREWGAVGFRSPAMHHNLRWLHELDVLYDASTFDTDPFEPQSDAAGTIFPFWVQGERPGTGYVELPYTLCQDFTLFILMAEQNIDIWKRKVRWVAQHGGMVLVNTHPDYMHFTGGKPGLEEFPVERYLELLQFLRDEYAGAYWHALPKDVARFYKDEIVQPAAPVNRSYSPLHAVDSPALQAV